MNQKIKELKSRLIVEQYNYRKARIEGDYDKSWSAASIIRNLEAEIKQLELKTNNGWMPIETAPKDGTWVLLTGGSIDYSWDGKTEPKVVVGQHIIWEDKWPQWKMAWFDSGHYGEYCNPTHWQPLPKLPNKQKEYV